MSQPEIVDLSFRDPGDLPVREVVRAIDEGITAYNSARRPDPSAGPLVLAMLGAGGAVVGGLRGRIAYGWLRIDFIWVSETLRGNGYGKMLLHAAERTAARRGCHSVHLDTHEFQAPAFYRAQGYEIFAELDDYPDGEKHLYFKKRLGSGAERT